MNNDKNGTIVASVLISFQTKVFVTWTHAGGPLLTWFNFTPSMDKHSHTQ